MKRQPLPFFFRRTVQLTKVRVWRGWLMWTIEFKPADCWIGVFPMRQVVHPNGEEVMRYDVWVTIVPMFPLHLAWPYIGPRRRNPSLVRYDSLRDHVLKDHEHDWSWHAPINQVESAHHLEHCRGKADHRHVEGAW